MDIPIFGFSPFSTTGIRSWVAHVSQNVFMLTLLSIIKMHLRVIFLWVIFLIVLCIVIIHKCSFDSFSIETVAIIAILKRYSYSERLRVSVWCLFSRTLWAEKNYPTADLRAKLCKLRYIGTCRKMFSIVKCSQIPRTNYPNCFAIPSEEMSCFSYLASWVNQNEILVDLLCQQSYLAVIMSLTSMKILTNMSHLQYHLK